MILQKWSIFMTTPINSNTGPSNNDYACGHNGRQETTVRDVLEHIVGNGEFGSAAAEAFDIVNSSSDTNRSGNDHKPEQPTPDNKA